MSEGGVPTCASCGRRLVTQESVFRCLSVERRKALEPFLVQYRIVRQRDGYRAGDADYYRALPSAHSDDPQRAIWEIRSRSFRRLCDVIGSSTPAQPTVLDVGAGSGWLSYQLVKLGWRATAVDLLTDERDGLGAHRHYDVEFACVQADFDALPFAPGQFDCVVFNASLHFADDVGGTLRRASRLLNARGLLLVVDSPMFVNDRDGIAMRRRDRERLQTEYHLAEPIQPGEGYLTFRRLASYATSLGRTPRYFQSADGWRRRLRRAAAAAGLGDWRPAQFGVWVAA
jgi:SAM-dependent methyltransferase